MTTACPSAASVGASTIASRRASMNMSSPKQGDPRESAGHDGQRQPDREQAKRHDVLAAQCSRGRSATRPRRARRVSVASATQRTDVAADRRVEPAEGLGARQHAAGDEHHRRGDRGPREPARDRRVREDEERDRDETRTAHLSFLRRATRALSVAWTRLVAWPWRLRSASHRTQAQLPRSAASDGCMKAPKTQSIGRKRRRTSSRDRSEAWPTRA